MEWVETTAPSVEEAKDAALDRLGVDAQEAEFEVVEEAQKGWFGRVKSEARVRARIKPTAPRPKQERRDRNRKGNNKNRSNNKGGNRSGGDNRGGQKQKNSGQGNRGGSQEQSGGGRKAAAAGGAAAVAGGAAAAVAGASSNDGGSNNPQHQPQGQQEQQPQQAVAVGGDANGGDQANQGNQNKNQRNRGGSANKGNKKMHNESDMSVADQADVAKTFMEGLVKEMGLTGSVAIENVLEDEATVQVTGEGVGLLVGPGGRTLQSLQELSRTVIQRHAGGSPNGRIRIDVGGYRAKRKEALIAFVGKVAADVVESGKAHALEPMGSQDRKIAHDAATDIAGVSTTSEGEEPRRRVVIVPAD